MIDVKTVTIVGAGNVASWFAYKLNENNFIIREIYSRNPLHAKLLAQKYNAIPISKIEQLAQNSDIYIFSLKDDAYQEVLQQLNFKLPLAIHTSGPHSIGLLLPYSQLYGMIYPCQTISAEISFEQIEVPLCVEGNSKFSEDIFFQFASLLSSKVVKMDEKQRFALHIAAVFASNFTNAMYDIAYNILQKEKIDWQIVLPLIQNTIDKTKVLPPQQVQTGPAKRRDENIMQRHYEQLENKELKQIYQLLSNYIMNRVEEKKG